MIIVNYSHDGKVNARAEVTKLPPNSNKLTDKLWLLPYHQQHPSISPFARQFNQPTCTNSTTKARAYQ